ncbi:hypothetical protein BDZ89DRAFT_1165025 [Hymenopellis radicata]|nr:hypothetical protein BDZ89DRAFT_1165025 [Hymenopellis radicata]
MAIASSSNGLRQNTTHSSAPWLVQKFGGTSVGKFSVNIARDIVSTYIHSNKVAVVCSARSGSTKALGTTNLLLKAASEALFRCKSKSNPTSGTATPNGVGLFARLKAHNPRHSGSYTAGALQQANIRDADIRKAFEDEVDADCEWLRNFLFASQIIDEISPRAKDSIVGLGERLACKYMTAVVRDQGIDAEYVSLEDIVPEMDDDTYTGSLDQVFYDRLSVAVGERVRACGARVPVGFFGPVPGSLLTQVGRGYTGFLSALLAVGLSAGELQIWKEVDGIFTADPRQVATARVIPLISPDEAAELTYYGSEVVSLRSLSATAVLREIAIRVFRTAHELAMHSANSCDHSYEDCLSAHRQEVGNRHFSTVAYDVVGAAKSDNQTLWAQLYPTTMTRAEWLDWIKTRQEAGYSATVITLDVVSDPLESRNWRAGNEHATLDAPFLNIITWDDVQYLKDNSPLPIVLQGIQTYEDTVLARDIGVAAIYLSNHGNRAADGVQSPLEVLLEIRKNAPGLVDEIPIFIDGGIYTATTTRQQPRPSRSARDSM